MKLCYEWINLGLQGIDYYNTYYKIPLLFCVTFAGFGWIILLILETNPVKKRRKVHRYYIFVINVTCVIIAVSSSVFISGKHYSSYILLMPTINRF